MPRDINGNYTLPAGNPVVSGTFIQVSWANPTMSDIAIALSDSLSRSGKGGMLVPFRNADGNIGNPGVTWNNEPTSGWYRAGTNDFWYAIGGVNIFRITAAGIELATGKTGTNITAFTRIQDTEPVAPPVNRGEQWYESDTAGYYLRYQNPDLTYTWVSLAPAGGNFAGLDVNGKVPDANLPVLNYNLAGLQLANDPADTVNDIIINAGVCADSTNSSLIRLTSAMSKRLDAAWFVGTGQGGLDTGVVANNYYHVFVIMNPASGAVDCLFSLSPTSPVMPVGFTRWRRVGSILRPAGSILAFVQDGDYFQLASIIGEVAATNPGTAAVTRTLSSVPNGVRVRAVLHAGIATTFIGSGITGLLSDLSVNDQAAGTTTANIGIDNSNAGGAGNFNVVEVWTSTARQLRSRLNFSDASTTLFINLRGWIDLRGKEGGI